MEYRKFGHTDLTVSAVGFGAWAIGGPAMAGNTPIGWGDVDDNQSRTAIHRALEQGITFLTPPISMASDIQRPSWAKK
ncbi:MAG: hypothetical protein H6555_00825 [Lewinellaceae bacterium]|nr:hypothetical protein [Lewinellaceae bacterium]